MEMTTEEYNRKVKKGRSGGTGLTEHQIQTMILAELNGLEDGMFWRENSGAFVFEGEDGKRRFFRAGVKGIADIVGIYKGLFVAIEVKRPETRNRVSPYQVAFLEDVKSCGGIAFVCWDADRVKDQLMNQYRLYGVNATKQLLDDLKQYYEANEWEEI